MRLHRTALLLILAAACAPPRGARIENLRPAHAIDVATQLLVVTTPDWDATSGTLQRYRRESVRDSWHAEGAPAPIVVGRTGLAWGTGNEKQPGPQKREGDGRAPAGIFTVGQLFGFAPPDSMRALRMPYLQLTTPIECVDDTASVHYNAIVDRNAVPRVDWASSEHMRRVEQYRIGFVVNYNAAPPVKGRGSCIFFHVWNGPTSSTVGCTAMDAQLLGDVMAWLDPRARPVIVQLPRAEYERLRASWALP